MERLVAEFKSRSLSVSTIKNAHHGFDVDQPGKIVFVMASWGPRGSDCVRETLGANA